MDSERRAQEVIQRLTEMPGVQRVTGQHAAQWVSLELDETRTTRDILEDRLAMWGYCAQPWKDARSPLEPHLSRRRAEDWGRGPVAVERRGPWWTGLSWGVAGVLGITAVTLFERGVQPGLLLPRGLHGLQVNGSARRSATLTVTSIAGLASTVFVPLTTALLGQGACIQRSGAWRAS